MLSRPPSQMISVVAPARFVLGTHRDQQAVLAGPDGEHIGTRPLVLLARQPRRHLDHHSVTIVDRQFAGNSFPLGNLVEGLHLPPELRLTLEPQPVAGVFDPHADDGLVRFNGGVPYLVRHRERGRIAMRGQATPRRSTPPGTAPPDTSAGRSALGWPPSATAGQGTARAPPGRDRRAPSAASSPRSHVARRARTTRSSSSCSRLSSAPTSCVAPCAALPNCNRAATQREW